MIRVCLQREIDESLGRQLEQFEQSFTYPLGPTTSFRIGHSPDYLRFYQSLGDAVLVVALEADAVLGTIAVVIRTVFDPESQPRDVAYFGDLKVRLPAEYGRGLVAARLLQAASRWALDRVSTAVAIVMDGTTPLPDQYTGRLGIPSLQPIARLAIWRFATETCGDEPAVDSPPPEQVARVYRELTRGTFAMGLGESSRRSQMRTLGLLADRNLASGLVEDTRKAKRLFVVGGDELVSAHLSNFAFRNVDSAATVIRAAQAQCARRSIPGLFVAVDETWGDELLRTWRHQTGAAESAVRRAAAIVYGHGLTSGARWHISTAEI